VSIDLLVADRWDNVPDEPDEPDEPQGAATAALAAPDRIVTLDLESRATA
jgi:hypothetical protein